MSTPETLGQLQPGDVVQLPDVSHLAAFEDVLALTMLPTMRGEMWRNWVGRPLLKEFLRPTKANCGVSYNGAITDVQLVVMDEPYARLEDARERGWKFYQHTSPTTPVQKQETIDSYRGFIFTGQARSSGRRGPGQIQAELWYGLISLRTWTGIVEDMLEGSTRLPMVSKQRCRPLGMNGGSPIKRYFTKPRFETEAFLELQETSRKVGIQVLRHNMRHPLLPGMSQ